ncbi:hypothetical protein [Chryseolinea sp. H1M3-3]|uniref:hypothetical protein n=1 Tax=Chryseolinea sp. H1M3-3 TaxID=3034144 RepID=UPI0023EDCACB|nr:hypothetical protein [Chryseolinea sp. H1M3-3]
MKPILRTVVAVSVFSIAMAALESAVVVYLRALYYPEEFTVQFKIIDQHILLIEIVREIATLAMLASIGFIAGNNFRERMAYFLISFAVWDVFYYGWLKVFIDWPASFLDWDILFLIPITWIGPVAAPIICSLTMIVLAVFLLLYKSVMTRATWTCLVLGTLLILFTFTRDYAQLIALNDFVKDYPNLMQNPDFVAKAAMLTPKPYAWNIFWAGEFMFLLAIINVKLNKYHGMITREMISTSQ